jgi:hypothetical protein
MRYIKILTEKASPMVIINSLRTCFDQIGQGRPQGHSGNGVSVLIAAYDERGCIIFLTVQVGEPHKIGARGKVCIELDVQRA